MSHREKPQTAELSEDLKSRLDALQRSDYFAYLEPLEKQVKGRVVAASSSGKAGFILRFQDGGWVISYLEGDSLLFRVGDGTVSPEAEQLLHSKSAGDASRPLTVDLPYAAEPCDVGVEVAKCHGQPVEGLSRGERCFNFCFPGGMELDTMVVPDNKGRPALRVFWEQW